MKRRILLVDDDIAVLLTLKTVLEMNQFEVDTAASAAEAQTKLVSGVYHMVITDARMEHEAAGAEVIRAARSQPYSPATAFLTAYPPDDEDWQNTGADSLMVKPIGVKELVRQIEAVLIHHADEKALRLAASPTPGKNSTAMHREPRRKVS